MRYLMRKIFATAAVFCVASCSETSNEKVSENRNSTAVIKKFYAVDTLSPECIKEVFKAKKITLYSIYPDREVDTLPGIFEKGLYSNDQCQRIVSLQSIISMSKDADGGIAEVIGLTLYHYIRDYPQDLVLILSNAHIFDSTSLSQLLYEVSSDPVLVGEPDTLKNYISDLRSKTKDFDDQQTLKVEEFIKSLEKEVEIIRTY